MKSYKTFNNQWKFACDRSEIEERLFYMGGSWAYLLIFLNWLVLAFQFHRFSLVFLIEFSIQNVPSPEHLVTFCRRDSVSCFRGITVTFLKFLPLESGSHFASKIISVPILQKRNRIVHSNTSTSWNQGSPSLQNVRDPLLN